MIVRIMLSLSFGLFAAFVTFVLLAFLIVAVVGNECLESISACSLKSPLISLLVPFLAIAQSIYTFIWIVVFYKYVFRFLK